MESAEGEVKGQAGEGLVASFWFLVSGGGDSPAKQATPTMSRGENRRKGRGRIDDFGIATPTENARVAGAITRQKNGKYGSKGRHEANDEMRVTQVAFFGSSSMQNSSDLGENFSEK